MNVQPRRTIAIIGAGFCGAVLAGRLLRAGFAAPTRILLIERAPAFARGPAYTRRDHPYLLNVAAIQMSAAPEVPDEFLQFARRHLAAAGPRDFLPRSLYGDYLEETLRSAGQHAHDSARLVRVRASVQSLRRSASGSAWTLQLDGERQLVANDVVLATGNPPSARWGGAESADDLLSHEPWDLMERIDAARSVLLIGSGLTCCDVVMRASAAQRVVPTMTVVSRHGLLPESQRSHQAMPGGVSQAPLLAAAGRSSRELLRAARDVARGAVAAGGDWREAVVAIREAAPQLWQLLPAQERGRFLRHAQSHWNVHRHRLPPQVAARIAALRAAGSLRIHAGRMQELEHRGQRVRALWRPRDGGGAVEHVADVVVNCTGPNYRIDCSPEPLMRSLRTQGFVSADAHALGLRTDECYRVVGANGVAHPDLYYVGPLLRARYWEATAVPELRVHAQRLAQLLAGAGHTR